MLNIGRLGVSRGAEYYLATVGSGVDDYYVRGDREAAGRWLGGGSAALGLDGEVGAQSFRAVLAGRHPVTGQPLGRERKVPGFDLTFRAPKSVSILWGLGDRQLSAEVRAAHDAAVDAAMAYVETEVVRSRRGRGGVEQVATRGVVAAAFVHRTSRAGDMLLHTHVVVANSVQAVDDGLWRTLDGRLLYRHAKTAGYLYQAQLRAELTRRLGVEWQPVVNGCADLANIPRGVVEEFSQRRAAILNLLAERGESSAAAAQVATLATRQPKRDVAEIDLRRDWHDRALRHGLDREQLHYVIRRRVWQPPTPDHLHTVAQLLLSPQGLTEHASTFTRRDVLRGFAEQLREGGDVAHVRALADWLTDPSNTAVVPLDHALAVTRHLSAAANDETQRDPEPFERRWTTPELLAIETEALSTALGRHHDRFAVANADAVEQAIGERPSMSDDQAAMVRRLCLDGAGVQLVVGKAGTGKTFSLDAARAAFEASGILVQGCALAARAAAELEAGAGIPATTLARTIPALAVDALRSARPQRALIVDEAAMCGTRDLAQLLALSGQLGVKTILVGDHHQLPEVHAGGLFHALVNRLPAVELTVNRRQSQLWERDALDQLRHGDPTIAMRAYDAHGRIVTGSNADRLRDQLVADWQTAHVSRRQALMIAATRADVDDLNTRARQRLARAGPLKGPALQTATGREFQIGDRVIAGRNRYHLGLLNGTRGSVTALDHERRTLTLTVDGSDRDITVPATYLEAGHLDHGYAVTCHKAQGATVDATFTLGSERLYRELAYVALSRGRDSNTLYTVAGTDLTRALEQSRRQGLALEWAR